MGPYLFANAALTGFFLFGAIYHFILSSRTRQNRTLLLFAVVTLLTAVNSFAMVGTGARQGSAWLSWTES